MRSAKKKHNRRKKIIVAVSGGFDPMHVGHIRLFRAAKKLGDQLVVILNNDNWLYKKKGFAFIPVRERKEIIKALSVVDKVIVTNHSRDPNDMSVAAELFKIKPDIFANGGDRTSRKKTHQNNVSVCEKINCRLVFGLGKKTQSSSWLLENYFKKL